MTTARAGNSQNGSRPVIVRAVQTCSAGPSQWDAWDDEGRYWQLRFSRGWGTAQRGDSTERGPVFGEDDESAGVISLEEFCERAGIELRLP